LPTDAHGITDAEQCYREAMWRRAVAEIADPVERDIRYQRWLMDRIDEYEPERVRRLSNAG